MKGNQRYVQDQLLHANRDQERREALVSKQNPYAIILGCSDSRVSPEILFDQGVGDLFVVRVAGNVAGPLELDSIQYSALYLGSVVILVLGHENCGAVDAVVQNKTEDIEAVAKLIAPAVKTARKENDKNLLERSIKANALRMRQLLLDDSVIGKLVQQKKIEVHAGYYDLQTGAVELLTSSDSKNF